MIRSRARSCYRPPPMIALSGICKQYGRQVLFVDASFQLNPGEKIGLVGPNGAGKTTIFRLITGEEHADDGDVSVPKKLSIGYFRQEIDEMAGLARPRRGDRGQRAPRRPPPRADRPRARARGSGARRRDGEASWHGSATCRPSTSSAAATSWRPAPARCSTASASTTRASTATSARCRAAGRCASRWRRSSSAGPTSSSWTSRRTTSTSSRSSGSRSTSRATRARSS